MGVMPAPSPLQDTNISALADLQGIMQRTEDGMLAVQPCTTADAYFAGAILPHREGAVEMCEWMTQYGSDAQLRNISDAVYYSPTEGQIYQSMPYLPPCMPAPAPAPAAMSNPRAMAKGRISSDPAVAIRSSMNMDPAAPLSGHADHDFAIQMAAHHEASINMARVELLRGTYEPLRALASELIVTQTKQVMQFRQILQTQYATVI